MVDTHLDEQLKKLEVSVGDSTWEHFREVLENIMIPNSNDRAEAEIRVVAACCNSIMNPRLDYNEIDFSFLQERLGVLMPVFLDKLKNNIKNSFKIPIEVIKKRAALIREKFGHILFPTSERITQLAKTGNLNGLIFFLDSIKTELSNEDREAIIDAYCTLLGNSNIALEEIDFDFFLPLLEGLLDKLKLGVEGIMAELRKKEKKERAADIAINHLSLLMG